MPHPARLTHTRGTIRAWLGPPVRPGQRATGRPRVPSSDAQPPRRRDESPTCSSTHNPVDWFPGSRRARPGEVLDRPIFLSIGYAACHWCHVMERESFEDLGDRGLPQRALRLRQG